MIPPNVGCHGETKDPLMCGLFEGLHGSSNSHSGSRKIWAIVFHASVCLGTSWIHVSF